ncbi:hypothetical protein D9M71_438130 [compost metagenome]
MQLVGADLVEQANATPFLAQVQQYTTAFAGDGLQGSFELRAAIATLAEQGVTGQAFGMQATQYRFPIRHVAEAEHNMLAAGGFIEKTMHGEFCKRGRQLRSGNEDDGHRVLLIKY